jgi:hypothetical protein
MIPPGGSLELSAAAWTGRNVTLAGQVAIDGTWRLFTNRL